MPSSVGTACQKPDPSRISEWRSSDQNSSAEVRQPVVSSRLLFVSPLPAMVLPNPIRVGKILDGTEAQIPTRLKIRRLGVFSEPLHIRADQDFDIEAHSAPASAMRLSSPISMRRIKPSSMR